jgi:hypothetical protein
MFFLREAGEGRVDRWHSFPFDSAAGAPAPLSRLRRQLPRERESIAG